MYDKAKIKRLQVIHHTKGIRAYQHGYYVKKLAEIPLNSLESLKDFRAY